MLVTRALVDGLPRYGEVEVDVFHPFEGDPWTSPKRSGASVAMADLTLLCPVEPGRILVQIGGFLQPETTLPPGTRPLLVPKLAAPVSGDQGVIVIPPSFPVAVAEVELAIVIGRDVSDASAEEARTAIFGFTCFNDVTEPVANDARDWVYAKSIDTFASMGPWVRTVSQREPCGSMR